MFNGTVTDVIYVGDTTKYRVRVTDDLGLTAKRQNRAGHHHIVSVDTVRLGWSAEDGSFV